MIQVLAHDHSVINDDRVHIEVVTSRPASQQSSHADDSFGYQTIKTSIQQIWRDENVVVAPGEYMDGLVQERRNSRALAMDLRLSCTIPSKCGLSLKAN